MKTFQKMINYDKFWAILNEFQQEEHTHTDLHNWYFIPFFGLKRVLIYFQIIQTETETSLIK